MSNLLQSLSSRLGVSTAIPKQPTSSGVTFGIPDTSTPNSSLSNSLASRFNTANTTSPTPTGPDTLDSVKALGSFLNPTQTESVRPLFAKAGQETKIGGGPVVSTAHDLVARTIEAIPNAALTLLADARTIGQGGKPGTVNVPFDISRIGLSDTQGQTQVQDTYTKMKKVFDQNQQQYPHDTGLNMALAAMVPFTDALNTLISGDAVTSLARAGIRATQYSPELDKALQQFGMQKVTPDSLTNEFVQKFNQKANQLITAGDTQGLDDLGQAANTIVQHATGKGVPQLNDMGKLVQNLSRLGLQDSKLGLTLKQHLYPEIAPTVKPEPLPGTRVEPGQAPAFGMSIQRVEPVGGAPKEIPDIPGTFTADKLAEQQGSKYLPEEFKPIEAAAFRDIATKGVASYVSQYVKNNGNIVSTDRAKSLFPEYEKDKTLSDAYQKPAKQIADAVYEKLLAENKGKGNNAVVIYGGGTGAGKSVAIRNGAADDAVVFEANLPNPESAIDRIEKALKAGYDVDVRYVYREPHDAFINGVLKRARTVTIDGHLKTHLPIPETLTSLIKHYKGDSRVSISVTDNSHGIDGAQDVKNPVDFFRDKHYSEENAKQLREKLQNSLEESRRQGTISGSTYTRTKGESASGGGQLESERTQRNDNRVNQSRGTKDVAQLLRMYHRTETSLRVAEENPIAHEKAYGPGKIEQYKKELKSLKRRIEYDPRISPVQDPTKLPNEIKPLEHRLDPLLLERSFLEDAIASNPAKELAKYANRNGELPEVLGNGTGKFQTKGDDIISQLGYEDSEQAREAYQQYRVQRSRLYTLNEDIKTLTKLQQELILDKDSAQKLVRLMNKTASASDKLRKPKRPSEPETPAQLAERKRIATVRMNSVLKSLESTQAPLEEESVGYRTQVQLETQPLTAEEFERMNLDTLPKTVIDTSTPVKHKINILDYFRTPDRVLKKIGLSNTADHVRHAYESYLAELPAHIETISAWSKEVPSKESNTRIFRWLDGQYKVVNHQATGDLRYLSPKELSVAKEIKAYLKDWADRLGLPDDNKISHYITHIFALNDVEKEFDEDIAKLITDTTPGSVYDPFLEKRLGRKGYIEDTWAALDAYAKRAVRKANMDPVLEKLKDASERLETSQATYVKRFAERINMRPTEWDTLLDNAIKTIAGYRFGQRPVAVITHTYRQWVYRSFLGLNVGSAIKNLTQGVNTFATLGTKYTLHGYIDLITKVNSGELESVGILRQDLVQGRQLSSTRKKMQKIDKGLFFLFETAEKINRGAAYYGAKAQAIDSGADEVQAIKYAKKIVRDTQFQFNSIDTPVALNSDIARVLSQFLTFGVKQAEFATENIMARNYAAIFRYIAASLFMTYVVGKAFNIKGQDFIPGYSFTKFGTPPSFALPLSIINAITNAPDAYGHTPTLSKKALNIAGALPIPASLEVQKLMRNWQSGVGLVTPKKSKKNTPSGTLPVKGIPALDSLRSLNTLHQSNPALNSLSGLNLNL